MDKTLLATIDSELKRLPQVNWYVPEYDKQKITLFPVGQIEFDIEFNLAIIPRTNGNVETCEFIAKSPFYVRELVSEVNRLQCILDDIFNNAGVNITFSHDPRPNFPKVKK